jgi:hypothetical protein
MTSKAEKTTAIVVGAGMRGFTYAHFQQCKPEAFQVKLGR